VDAQKQKVRVHAKRNERTRFELVGDRPRHLPDEFRALGTDAVEADGLERPVAAAASNIPAPGPAAPSLVGLCRRRIFGLRIHLRRQVEIALIPRRSPFDKQVGRHERAKIPRQFAAFATDLRRHNPVRAETRAHSGSRPAARPFS
jgi:hypothetical protein